MVPQSAIRNSQFSLELPPLSSTSSMAAQASTVHKSSSSYYT